MLLFALIVTTIFVFFTITLLTQNILRSNDILTYPVAVAVSFSTLSYSYYLSLLFQLGYIPLLLTLITCCISIILTLLLLNRLQWKGISKIWNIQPNLILTIGIIILTVRFNKYVYRWGDWDAWAIWTLHAKFLFYPEFWSNMFTTKLATTHPDYPLMLPSIIAFLWRGIGFITPLIPVIVAHLTGLMIPVLVFFALKKSGYLLAILSLILFTVDTKFIHIWGSQYADTLLSLFILSTIVLYKVVNTRSDASQTLLGLIAASSTWIKNEGLLFFLIFSCAYVCLRFKHPSIILRYIAGAVIPLVILLHFKLTFAPANDLIHSDRGSDILQFIATPDRYLLIIRYFFVTSIQYYWIILVLFAIIVLRKIPFLRTLPFIVFSLMLAGYFMIYLTTPNDLDWHLGASIDRLFHHIYPACLYILLLKLNSVYQLPFTFTSFSR
jgi:hypothetical protein